MNIENLSDEVLVNIFGFFSVRDLTKIIPKVNKVKWKRIAEDDELWKDKLREEFGVEFNFNNDANDGPKKEYEKHYKGYLNIKAYAFKENPQLSSPVIKVFPLDEPPAEDRKKVFISFTENLEGKPFNLAYLFTVTETTTQNAKYSRKGKFFNILLEQVLDAIGEDQIFGMGGKENALGHAVKEKNSRALRIILKKSTDDKIRSEIKRVKNNGHTPLTLAALNGDKETFEFLFSKYTHDKQDICTNEIIYEGQNCNQLVHYAILGKNTDIIRQVFDHIAPQSKSNIYLKPVCQDYSSFVKNAFILAIENAIPVEFIREILGQISDKESACLVSPQNSNSEPPLHLAAKLGNYLVVREILAVMKDKEQACLKTDALLGATPLHYAARSGNKKVVKAILDEIKELNKENVCLMPDDSGLKAFNCSPGYTPLHYVAQVGELSCIQEVLNAIPLIKRKEVCQENLPTAPISSFSFTRRLSKRPSVLILAWASGNTKAVEEILQYIDNREVIWECLVSSSPTGKSDLINKKEIENYINKVADKKISNFNLS